MTGKYFFNDQDAYTSFGVIFKKGTFGQLLSLPGAWPDETRKMGLPILIEGKNESDFWIKYKAISVLITSGNDFTFLVGSLNRRFKLAYESMSSFNMLTQIKGGNEVYCDFVLNIIDDYPDTFQFTRTGIFTKAGTAVNIEFSRTYTSYALADAIVFGNADASFAVDGQTYANK